MTIENNEPRGDEQPRVLRAEVRQAAAGRSAPVKRSGGRKLTRRLVVVSAAAILSVYAAGYALTAPAAAQIAAQTAAVQNAPRPASTPSVATTTVTSSSTTATPTVLASGYKDGTYTGVGTIRHGDIQAQVVIQNGKIVSAQITQASTRYPVSRIASLAGEVLAQQSITIDLVSGATDSSQAYLGALANALAQAS